MILKKISLIAHVILLTTLSANVTAMEGTHTHKDLVTCSVDYLNKNKEIYNAYEQKSQEFNLTTCVKEYKSIIEKYEQLSPLFLLSECTEEIGNVEHNDNCLLSRTYKPNYRNAFEAHASQLLINKLQTSPTNPITYTSFGCGAIFQDLIIITKALIQKPKALLTIHLIDGNNTPYVSAIDFLNYSREIKTEQHFSFGSRLAEYEEYARNKEKNDPEIKAMTQQELQCQLLLLCLAKEAQYKQFLSWLTKSFSQATISLYLHDQINNYHNFINKNNYAHADVVTAADITDDESIATHSIPDYIALCKTTLEKNPASVNAWLCKIDNNSVGIVSASLPTADTSGKICLNIEKI